MMESILSKHLDLVGGYVGKNASHVQQMSNEYRNMNLNTSPTQIRNIEDWKSIEFRNQGNVLFKNQDYKQARVLYTKSIAAAVCGPLCALGYANRSAALFHMNFYEDCLKDIERALSMDYPEKNRYKLYLRETRCMKYLGKNFEDNQIKILQHLRMFNVDNLKELEAAVVEEMELLEPEFEPKMPSPNDWTLPSLSYGVNHEVPAFSSAVSLVHTKSLGRHIVANRDIKTGDVLIVDESIVAALLPEVQWEYCSYCFKYCLSLLPCQICGYVMYCSEKCRDKDWSVSHKGACISTRAIYNGDGEMMRNKAKQSLMGGNADDPGPINCCLARLLSTFGVSNLQEVATEKKPIGKFNSSPRSRGFENEKFTLSLRSLLSLEDNFEKMPQDEKMKHCELAVALTEMEDVPYDEMVPMSALMLKLHLILFYNKKSMQVFHVNYERIGIPRTEIGIALYLAASLINHSCDPNMYRVTYGRHAVYRAKRGIRKGDQLTECYHVSVMNNRSSDRQKLCQALSLFECKCEACEKTWPLVKMMPDFPWKESEMGKILLSLGINISDQQERLKLAYFTLYNLPADVAFLPKLVVLLKELQRKDLRMNKLYFQVQDCIKNYYRAQGSSLFFGDSKNILMGLTPFDSVDATQKTDERAEKARVVPGPFGWRALI